MMKRKGAPLHGSHGEQVIVSLGERYAENGGGVPFRVFGVRDKITDSLNGEVSSRERMSGWYEYFPKRC